MLVPCKFEDLAIRFAPYIEELREFFAGRHVQFGLPENIPAFVARLSASDAFREDMSCMVRSFIYRERDGLHRIDLLELILIAVGGAQVDEAAERVHEPVRQVLAFVDGALRSRWNTGLDESNSSGPASEAVEADSAGLTNVTGDVAAIVPEPLGLAGLREDPGAEQGSAPVAPEAPVMGPRSSSSSFSRARALSPESSESKAGVELEPNAEPEPSANFEPDEKIESKGVLDSSAKPVGNPVPTSGWYPLGIPVAEADQPAGSQRWFWTVAACVILLALGMGLVYGRRQPGGVYGPSAETKAAAGPRGTVAKPSGALAEAGTANADSPDANIPPNDGIVGSPNAGQQAEAAVSAGDIPGRSEKEEDLGRSEPFASGSRLASRFAGNGANRVAGALAVPPGLMVNHLLSAPQPKYPKLAGMLRVEGRVIVQAIVAQNGTVAATHVLEGHRLLRGAAMHAVRRWKFRPYLVDGRPAEVVTTVNVNFHINR